MGCQSTDNRGYSLGIDENQFIKIKNTRSRLMQNKHKLKFGNINTTTCKTDEKLTQNILAVKNLGQEMCVFSETHRVTSGIEVLENWPVESGLNGWKYIGTGNEKRAQSGVGVVLSPEFKVIENFFI